MKVILKEDINNLGQAGDIVEVKRGYANNYLLRQHLAVRANQANLNELKTQQKAIEAKRAKNLATAEEKAEHLKGRDFLIKVRTGEAGRLFGSVTTMNVAEVLEAEGFEVDRRDLALSENIKEIGTYKAHVKLHPEVEVDIVLHVEDEDEEKQKRLVAAKEAELAKRNKEAGIVETAKEQEVEKQIEEAVAAAEEVVPEVEEAAAEEAVAEEATVEDSAVEEEPVSEEPVSEDQEAVSEVAEAEVLDEVETVVEETETDQETEAE